MRSPDSAFHMTPERRAKYFADLFILQNEVRDPKRQAEVLSIFRAAEGLVDEPKPRKTSFFVGSLVNIVTLIKAVAGKIRERARLILRFF